MKIKRVGNFVKKMEPWYIAVRMKNAGNLRWEQFDYCSKR